MHTGTEAVNRYESLTYVVPIDQCSYQQQACSLTTKKLREMIHSLELQTNPPSHNDRLQAARIFIHVNYACIRSSDDKAMFLISNHSHKPHSPKHAHP